MTRMDAAGLLDRLRRSSGNLAEASSDTLRHASAVCAKLGVRATLNLGVADGERMAFARYSAEGQSNSLYYVEVEDTSPEAVVVASERLDGDAGWREVQDRHMLLIDRKSDVVLHPL
jgi:predicted glutamine amidotransferase